MKKILLLIMVFYPMVGRAQCFYHGSNISSWPTYTATSFTGYTHYPSGTYTVSLYGTTVSGMQVTAIKEYYESTSNPPRTWIIVYRNDRWSHFMVNSCTWAAGNGTATITRTGNQNTYFQTYGYDCVNGNCIWQSAGTYQTLAGCEATCNVPPIQCTGPVEVTGWWCMKSANDYYCGGAGIVSNCVNGAWSGVSTNPAPSCAVGYTPVLAGDPCTIPANGTKEVFYYWASNAYLAGSTGTVTAAVQPAVWREVVNGSWQMWAPNPPTEWDGTQVVQISAASCGLSTSSLYTWSGTSPSPCEVYTCSGGSMQWVPMSTTCSGGTWNMQTCSCTEFGGGVGGEVWLRQDQFQAVTNNVWQSDLNNARLISNEIARASTANVNALNDVKSAVNTSAASITNAIGSQTGLMTNAIGSLAGTVTNQTGIMTNFLGGVGTTNGASWSPSATISVTSSNFPIATVSGSNVVSQMQTLFGTSHLTNIIPITKTSSLLVNFGKDIPGIGPSLNIDLSPISTGVTLVRAILLGFEIILAFQMATYILRWSIA